MKITEVTKKISTALKNGKLPFVQMLKYFSLMLHFKKQITFYYFYYAINGFVISKQKHNDGPAK